MTAGRRLYSRAPTDPRWLSGKKAERLWQLDSTSLLRKVSLIQSSQFSANTRWMVCPGGGLRYWRWYILCHVPLTPSLTLGHLLANVFTGPHADCRCFLPIKSECLEMTCDNLLSLWKCTLLTVLCSVTAHFKRKTMVRELKQQGGSHQRML